MARDRDENDYKDDIVGGPDNDIAELLDGSFDAGDEDLEDKFLSDREEEKLEDGATPDAGAGPFHVVDPIKPQPLNRATHECLRGPCIHYWNLVARYVTTGDEMRIKQLTQCNCHQEATLLTGQNIYVCGQWWPSWMDWVPASIRGVLRPRLRAAYRHVLEKLGYDFSWRKFPDDVFHADRKEFRGDSGIGGKRWRRLEDAEGK